MTELAHPFSYKANDDTHYAVNPHTLGNYRSSYVTLWSQAVVKETVAAEKWARTILAHKGAYVSIERETGVPWWVIGALHMRENGCNFRGVLHNGELIIGTGRKTRLVPKGRGPFTSFKQAAVDALKDYRWVKVWDVATVSFIMESFNGFGYRSRGIPSPYLYGGSSVQRKGKFVSDGVYDPNTWDSQLGGITVLKQLCKIDSGIAEQVAKGVKPSPAPSVPKGTGTAVVVSTTSGFAYYLGIAVPYIIGAVAIGLAVYVGWRIYQSRKQST